MGQYSHALVYVVKLYYVFYKGHLNYTESRIQITVHLSHTIGVLDLPSQFHV